MRRILSLLFCCSLFTFSAVAQTAPDEGGRAIDELRTGLTTSFSQGDLEKLLTFLDPEVIVTWQNGEVCRGPEEVRAFYHRMLSGEKPTVREIQSKPEVLGRQVRGDWAVSWGQMHDRFVLSDGSDLPLNSVFTATVAKRGDRWLVTSFHASVNAFNNPVIRLAVRPAAAISALGGALLGSLVLWGTMALRGRRQRKA